MHDWVMHELSPALFWREVAPVTALVVGKMMEGADLSLCGVNCYSGGQDSATYLGLVRATREQGNSEQLRVYIDFWLVEIAYWIFITEHSHHSHG